MSATSDSASAGPAEGSPWRSRRRVLARWTDNGVWTVAIGVIAFAISYPRALEMSTMEPFIKLAVGTLVAAGLASLALRRRLIIPAWLRPGTIGHGVPWFAALFLAYAATSILWTSEPRATFNAVIFYGALAALAYLSASIAAPNVVIRGAAFGGIIIAGASLAADKFAHIDAVVTYGSSPEARTVIVGLYNHHNIFAYSVCLLVPAVLSLSNRTITAKIVWISLATASLALMAIAGSATALIAAATAIAASLVVATLNKLPRRWTGEGPGRARRHSLRTYGSVIFASTTATAIAYAAITKVPEFLNKDTETLSGRVPLWHALINVWQEDHFWKGHGFGAVWSYHWLHTTRTPTVAQIEDQAGFSVGHGHNGFLDLAIQAGAIGATLYLAILVRATILAVRHLRNRASQASSWALVTVITIAVLSAAEPIWMSPLGWYVLITVATLVERAPRNDRLGPTHKRPICSRLRPIPAPWQRRQPDTAGQVNR